MEGRSSLWMIDRYVSNFPTGVGLVFLIWPKVLRLWQSSKRGIFSVGRRLWWISRIGSQRLFPVRACLHPWAPHPLNLLKTLESSTIERPTIICVTGIARAMPFLWPGMSINHFSLTALSPNMHKNLAPIVYLWVSCMNDMATFSERSAVRNRGLIFTPEIVVEIDPYHHRWSTLKGRAVEIL